MAQIRPVRMISESKPTLEGAGVHLRRAFSYTPDNTFDPFLLLDDFRSENPDDYLSGFPWHPHRGIETITYVIEGLVEHGDSLGNQGVIGPGDVQWMTAGSGIIHQEMPKGDDRGHMGGFQLWANLPARQKMMDPRYRDVTSSQIPRVSLPGGGVIGIISGEVNGVKGPVGDIVIEPEYLDISLPAGCEYMHPTDSGHNVFAYVFSGRGVFGEDKNRTVANGNLVHFGAGDQVLASALDGDFRFLLISGRPLREPVAWYGPIVMNTQAELKTAFEEYQNGTFIKHRPPAAK